MRQAYDYWQNQPGNYRRRGRPSPEGHDRPDTPGGARWLSGRGRARFPSPPPTRGTPRGRSRRGARGPSDCPRRVPQRPVRRSGAGARAGAPRSAACGPREEAPSRPSRPGRAVTGFGGPPNASWEVVASGQPPTDSLSPRGGPPGVRCTLGGGRTRGPGEGGRGGPRPSGADHATWAGASVGAARGPAESVTRPQVGGRAGAVQKKKCGRPPPSGVTKCGSECRPTSAYVTPQGYNRPAPPPPQA